VIDGADKLREGAKVIVRSEAETADSQAGAPNAQGHDKAGSFDRPGGGKKRRSGGEQKPGEQKQGEPKKGEPKQ